MTRRITAVVLTAAALALLLAVAAPRAEAMSFVDTQVQAGGLLIQNYIDKYGVAHQFVFPAVSMVRKGGGLPDSTLMWPADPWTGKTMAPGSSRGTYTYRLRGNGTAYSLTMHLSRGSYVFRGGMPQWLTAERDTASQQNVLLLQRYVETYAAAHSGAYPTPDLMTAAGLGVLPWPVNPWTGQEMAAGSTPGCFGYTAGGGAYTLKVMLTTGWWTTTLGPLDALGRLTTTPGP